jgi:hypothetical protein
MTRVLEAAATSWAQKVALEIELREALGGKWPVATADKVRQIKIVINEDAPSPPYEEVVSHDWCTYSKTENYDSNAPLAIITALSPTYPGTVETRRRLRRSTKDYLKQTRDGENL